jgi:hypothetical protein
MEIQALVFLCTCGQLAHYEHSYAGDGLSMGRLDVYRCLSGHVVQVMYPALVGQLWQRPKPETPPPFPGSW